MYKQFLYYYFGLRRKYRKIQTWVKKKSILYFSITCVFVSLIFLFLSLFLKKFVFVIISMVAIIGATHILNHYWYSSYDEYAKNEKELYRDFLIKLLQSMNIDNKEKIDTLIVVLEKQILSKNKDEETLLNKKTIYLSAFISFIFAMISSFISKSESIDITKMLYILIIAVIIITYYEFFKLMDRLTLFAINKNISTDKLETVIDYLSLFRKEKEFIQNLKKGIDTKNEKL